MSKQCEVCKTQTKPLLPLELYEEEEEYEVFVCSRCWNAIAGIVNRIVERHLKPIRRQIEYLDGITEEIYRTQR